MLPIDEAITEDFDALLVVGERGVLFGYLLDHSEQIVTLGHLVGEHGASLSQFQSQLNQLITHFPEHGILPECFIETVEHLADPVHLVLILQLAKEKYWSLISLDLDEVLLVDLFKDLHDVGMGELRVIEGDMGEHPGDRVAHEWEILGL